MIYFYNNLSLILISFLLLCWWGGIKTQEHTNETRSSLWGSRLFQGSKLLLLLLLGCKMLPEGSSQNDHHTSYGRVQALPQQPHVHVCFLFLQRRNTFSAVKLNYICSAFFRDHSCPISTTTRKLKFGPRWSSLAHTLTRRTYQHL